MGTVDGTGKRLLLIHWSECQREGKNPIRCAYCNAHARRYFHKAWSLKDQRTGILQYKEAEFYLDHYHKIYRLEAAAKDQPPLRVLELRAQMRPHFEAMKERALQELAQYPKKSAYGKALSYLIKNYAGFTLFLDNPEVPIDNNSQERLLRNHVVGRKTWYGTHSERGALTAAILFTLIESCKLNQVNPREYFARLVRDLHDEMEPLTPLEFKKSGTVADPASSEVA